MNIRYDEKGKFFTEVVSKDTVPVIIQTTRNRIIGSIHVRPGERLKDEINNFEQFFAVTEATIYNEKGEKLFDCEFFALNREYILWVLPKEEIMASDRPASGGES
jgi:hypothetical protein